MTSEPPRPEDDARPKVKIAIPEGTDVRDKLIRALELADVEVESVPRGKDVWAAIGDNDADVVIVRRSQLPADAGEVLEEHAANEEAPGIVVVTEEDDPVDRAELLAAGASRVVDPTDSPRDLGSILETIADVEAEGGIDGPEIRGKEARPRLADFLSRSDSMKRFIETASRVAGADASLLITGETGVGKERLARAIHAESPRADQPFVAVNCGALPEQLLESQLFGHERGAFTGADKTHRGHFEQADGGTIFLDEIGEVPPHLQVKLLTVLQRHEVQRLGGESPKRVDVRVMAATNKDLRDAIKEGDFREDLFYRLNVISLEIPPLRARREDIADHVGLLMQFFRGEIDDCKVESISESAMQAMLEYSWPGNVRELINAIERAMLLSGGESIELRDLPIEIVSGSADAATPPAATTTSPLPPNWRELTLKQVRDAATAEVERAFLDAVLREAEGRINVAAKKAGIGTRSLYDKMQRYKLSKDDYKPS